MDLLVAYLLPCSLEKENLPEALCKSLEALSNLLEALSFSRIDVQFSLKLFKR